MRLTWVFFFVVVLRTHVCWCWTTLSVPDVHERVPRAAADQPLLEEAPLEAHHKLGVVVVLRHHGGFGRTRA